MKAQKGFTIVELLIVIVVIAILAAITIVAFNGVQQRANNAATINTVGAYTKLIKLYMTGENAYPLTTSACLQTDSSCTTRSSALDANLKKYGTLPSGEGRTSIRYYYQIQTVDGVSSPLMLIYYLEGINQDCGVSNALNQTASLTYVTDTTMPRNAAANSGGRTLCFAHIPMQ